MKLDIAIGKHRNTVTWKNTQFDWTGLSDKLRSTHRTAETYADYLLFPKMKQDEIKDVGGFVGGYLAAGKRRSGSVVHRSVLTLDIDHSTEGAWETFCILFDVAACCYSTHKHKPGAERLRLVLPLARPVQADEYVAIGRKVADMVGIDLFDDTTYQPERLMYFPSTSSDGEFIYEEQDGEWLDPDYILGLYRNWRDVSEWAFSSRRSEVVARSTKKQGDPTEKTGVIGAFCRQYDMATAIETFLSDVYVPAEDGRYSFVGGSTSCGLVIYDNLFAYSHHGTDPAGGKLSNAFDLVRIHKFGELDAESVAQTHTKLPSYLAMCDWAAGLGEIRQRIATERISSAIADFVGTDAELEPIATDEEWMKQLNVDNKGNFLNTINNIVLFMQNDPNLKNKFSYDSFAGRFKITGSLPWRKGAAGTDFTNEDVSCLSAYVEQFGIPFTHVLKAIDTVKTAVSHHPVRTYLDKLRWDGEPRLESLFIDYLGAEDNVYVRESTRKAFTAAVARVYNPGTKYDNVIVLIGREGIGKSTILNKMAVNWFSDCLGDVHSKNGMESLRGVWLMEIAELATFRRSDIEAIKRFITSTVDIYRPAYGKELVYLPRQCIFIGTSNRSDILDGTQANRRFLPIATEVHEPTMDVWEQLEPWRVAQIWAEAKEYFEKGERLDLTGEALALSKKVKTEHVELDEREGAVRTYLEVLLPEDWADMSIYERRGYLEDKDAQAEKGVVKRHTVSALEVYCEVLGGHVKDATVYNLRPVHSILKQLPNWAYGRSARIPVYGKQRLYDRLK